MKSRFPFRLLAVSSGALALLFAPAPADAASLEGEWNVGAAVTSQYVFRGVRLAGESLQPAVNYFSDTTAFGLWSNVGLGDRRADDADPEIDLYASRTFSLSASWTLEPGFTLYTFPDAHRRRGFHSATFEPSLALSRTVHGVRFTPKIYYDVTRRGPTAELNADFAVPLASLGTELDFAATAGTFDWKTVNARAAPAVKNRGDYWLVGVTLPLQIGLHARVSLGVVYSEGHDNVFTDAAGATRANPAAGRRAVVSLSYTRQL